MVEKHEAGSCDVIIGIILLVLIVACACLCSFGISVIDPSTW